MQTNLTQEQFDALPVLDAKQIDELSTELKKCVSFIAIGTIRTDEGNARFAITYEGDEHLLYNSAIAMFRANDRISQIMSDAYLYVLHEKTVEGYGQESNS